MGGGGLYFDEKTVLARGNFARNNVFYQKQPTNLELLFKISISLDLLRDG